MNYSITTTDIKMAHIYWHSINETHVIIDTTYSYNSVTKEYTYNIICSRERSKEEIDYIEASKVRWGDII